MKYLKKFKLQDRLAILSLAVNTVTMITTLILLSIAIREIIPKISQIAETTEVARLQQKMVIVTPASGSIVPESAFASGISPFTDRSNYLVIAPVTGKNWIQGSGRLSVGPNGFWSTAVRFGETQHGCGEDFQVLLMATREDLEAGEIDKFPSDAILSNPVTVTRAPC